MSHSLVYPRRYIPGIVKEISDFLIESSYERLWYRNIFNTQHSRHRCNSISSDLIRLDLSVTRFQPDLIRCVRPCASKSNYANVIALIPRTRISKFRIARENAVYENTCTREFIRAHTRASPQFPRELSARETSSLRSSLPPSPFLLPRHVVIQSAHNFNHDRSKVCRGDRD